MFTFSYMHVHVCVYITAFARVQLRVLCLYTMTLACIIYTIHAACVYVHWCLLSMPVCIRSLVPTIYACVYTFTGAYYLCLCVYIHWCLLSMVILVYKNKLNLNLPIFLTFLLICLLCTLCITLSNFTKLGQIWMVLAFGIFWWHTCGANVKNILDRIQRSELLRCNCYAQKFL